MFHLILLDTLYQILFQKLHREAIYCVCVYVSIFKTHIFIYVSLFRLVHIENMFPTKYKLDIIIKHIGNGIIYTKKKQEKT